MSRVAKAIAELKLELERTRDEFDRAVAKRDYRRAAVLAYDIIPGLERKIDRWARIN